MIITVQDTCNFMTDCRITTTNQIFDNRACTRYDHVQHFCHVKSQHIFVKIPFEKKFHVHLIC